MEDYILKEIDKIGKLIEAILLKIGVLKSENKHEDIIGFSKSELVNQLNIDIDKLLQNEKFIEILIQERQFTNSNLEQFADLLFDFIETTHSNDEKYILIYSIQKIFLHLAENKHPFSFKMFYIMDEFKKYSR
jgi:two-component SAPR family response regulator